MCDYVRIEAVVVVAGVGGGDDAADAAVLPLLFHSC